MEIAVRINGRVRRLETMSLDTLVAAEGLDARSLVVECNGRIVRQAEWADIELAEGDILELLNFVGGG